MRHLVWCPVFYESGNIQREKHSNVMSAEWCFVVPHASPPLNLRKKRECHCKDRRHSEGHVPSRWVSSVV